MRADRDDIRLAPERRAGNYTMIIAGASVLVLAILLYIGLRDSDAPEAPAAAAVVRDSAIVAPAVVDTTAPDSAQQQAAPGATTGTTTTPRGDFNERQLAPPTSTVGAGAAPASESANAERLVIDGDLLKEIEDDAQPADAPAPNQLRTPQ